MITAILKYHGFEKKIDIPYFMHRIEIDILPELNFQEFIDCTPDNIIKYGKYSVIEPLIKKRLIFEYYAQYNDNVLIYSLRNSIDF